MASRFEAVCLGILDRMDEMKVLYTIAKHGRPVARLVPADADEGDRPLMGSLTLIAEEDAAYYSTGARWDAEPDLP